MDFHYSIEQWLQQFNICCLDHLLIPDQTQKSSVHSIAKGTKKASLRRVILFQVLLLLKISLLPAKIVSMSGRPKSFFQHQSRGFPTFPFVAFSTFDQHIAHEVHFSEFIGYLPKLHKNNKYKRNHSYTT